MPRGSKPGERRGGRQKGTLNKATREIKEIAQKYGAEAIDVLVKIMRSSENEASRVSAIKELLDRGYGKASQPLSNDADNPLPPIYYMGVPLAKDDADRND